MSVEAAESGVLNRRGSSSVPNLALEPNVPGLSRSVSIPAVLEQLDTCRDEIQDSRPAEQPDVFPEVVLAVPPPLRRSMRVSLPIKRFSPY